MFWSPKERSPNRHGQTANGSVANWLESRQEYEILSSYDQLQLYSEIGYSHAISEPCPQLAIAIIQLEAEIGYSRMAASHLFG